MNKNIIIKKTNILKIGYLALLDYVVDQKEKNEFIDDLTLLISRK